MAKMSKASPTEIERFLLDVVVVVVLCRAMSSIDRTSSSLARALVVVLLRLRYGVVGGGTRWL